MTLFLLERGHVKDTNVGGVFGDDGDDGEQTALAQCASWTEYISLPTKLCIVKCSLYETNVCVCVAKLALFLFSFLPVCGLLGCKQLVQNKPSKPVPNT